jgi:hypothetical protein
MTRPDPLDPPAGLSDLRALLDLYRREGELIEIEAEVDPTSRPRRSTGA